MIINLNKTRSYIINKIINRIRYLRYASNYISITKKNLEKIKKASYFFNKREYDFRKDKLKTFSNKNFSNFFKIKYDELNKNGYTIFSNDSLNNIPEYQKSFSFFDEKYKNIDITKMKFNGVFYTEVIDLKNIELRNILNIFIPLISKYLNIVPVVTSARLWYSLPSNQEKWIKSQLPHFDPEDIKQIKMYVALQDIDKSSGSFNLYDKEQSKEIKKRTEENKIAVNSKISEDIFQDYNFRELNLKKGDVALVDTANCYHFGARTKENYRKQLSILFNDPFCSVYPIFRTFNKKKDLIWDYSETAYDHVKISKKLKIF